MPEPDDKTNQILQDLCHWQGVIKVSNQSPEMVLEVLTYMKDFETAYKWANIYGVFDKFEQVCYVAKYYSFDKMQ